MSGPHLCQRPPWHVILTPMQVPPPSTGDERFVAVGPSIDSGYEITQPGIRPWPRRAVRRT